MTKIIINLAVSLVTAETETILNTYPEYPYQQAFSAPGLRQKLVSYVLSRIPGTYTVVDETEVTQMSCGSLSCCFVEPQRITDLIHQGIHLILREETDWMEKYIPNHVNSTLAPSSWFG